MESLKITITLTNTKGWKETKDISLSLYQSKKENGNDVLDEIVKQLINDYEKTGKNMNKSKKEDIKWRP
jgi:hypothetical protein